MKSHLPSSTSESTSKPAEVSRDSGLSKTFSEVRGLQFAASLSFILYSASIVAAALTAKSLLDSSITSVVERTTTPHPSSFPGIPFVLNGSLLGVGVLLLALATASVALNWLGNRFLTEASEVVTKRNREALLNKLLSLKLDALGGLDELEISHRLGRDSSIVAMALKLQAQVTYRSVPSLILMLTAVGTLFFAGTKVPALMSLLVITSIVLLVIGGHVLVKMSSTQRHRVRGVESRFDADLQSTLEDLASVRSMSLDDAALAHLKRRADRLSILDGTTLRTDNWVSSDLGGLLNFLRATFLAVGAYFLSRGEMSIGTLGFLLFALETMARPIRDLVQFLSQKNSLQSAEERIRAFELKLEGQEEKEGSQSTVSLPFPDAGVVHFENVTLNDDGLKRSKTRSRTRSNILKSFTADFEPGDMIGVVSPSSEKALAFAELLNRLREPTEGRILIGRTELKRYRLKLLRSTVTLVRARGHFLPGSIRDNLLAAHPEIDLDDQHVNQALSRAGATDLISALPQKLDTVIGEGGVELSGELSRRLELARAFLRKESRIYFFEEPTKTLAPDDIETLIGALNDLTERGVMIFLMTKSIELLAQTDRVLFMPDRGVPRIDDHIALLEANDEYRRTLGLSQRSLGQQNRPKPSSRVFSPSAIPPHPEA